jgi:hypothetical protein
MTGPLPSEYTKDYTVRYLEILEVRHIGYKNRRFCDTDFELATLIDFKRWTTEKASTASSIHIVVLAQTVLQVY